eukprot:jgi/Psemu1/16206/gm1.16206_g
MMKTTVAFLALLSVADAAGSFRGSFDLEGPSITCTLKGGTSQSQCDATTSDDGSNCVWCSLSSYGVCVDESIAVQMKATIPGLNCDDNDDDDDDDDDDDVAPSEDDDAPTDDSLPDDYWDCIKKYDDRMIVSVEDAPEAAKNYDDHLFFTCDFPSFGSQLEATSAVEDPRDLSCLIGSSDQSDCEGTKDADGEPCEWCSLEGFPVCMTNDQARFAEEVGGSCGDRAVSKPQALSDPYDPSCLFETIQGDESSCRATTDVDGNPCEWCSLQGIELCVNIDQADYAEVAGGSCSVAESVAEESTKEHKGLTDPYDPSCLAVTLEQDASLCKQSMDSEGNPCEWCSVQGFELCMNVDQAEFVEEAGGSCSKGQSMVQERVQRSDTWDSMCLVWSLTQDEGACIENSDMEQNPCKWCNILGYGVCMNGDQAGLMEHIVGTCGDGTAVQRVNGKELSDPYDPSCIVATLEQDESACKGTMDSDGKPCQWCSLQGYDFCVNVDQAQLAEQTGAMCDDRAVANQSLFMSVI